MHPPQLNTVALFIPCLIDAFYPEIGHNVVALLRRLGHFPKIPLNQTCCGQPAYNSGYHHEARRAARHFIEVFESAPCIVSPSGSCVHMVRHHYAELFKKDRQWQRRARNVAAKTYELSEFIVDILGRFELDSKFQGRVTYHDSCHLLRGLGIQQQPRKLIKAITGAEFTEMPSSDECCGFGGAFAVKYPAISTAMLEKKINTILASGADTVVGCDMGCLMHIQGRLQRRNLPIKVRHIAQIL